jgi:hypothetical protein
MANIPVNRYGSSSNLVHTVQLIKEQEMIVTKNDILRTQVLDTIRNRMVQEREGIHLSDLIYCSRKAYWKKQHMQPTPGNDLCILWMTGYAFQEYMFSPKRFDITHPRESFMAWSIVFEGCISLGKGTTKHISQITGEEKEYITLVPMVQLSNTQYNLLDSFQKLVGYGHVEKNGSTKSGAPYWSWEVKSMEEVKRVCEEMLPYLPSKRKQAELLIEFCTIRLEKPKERVDREEQIFQEMRSLNEKGKFRYNSNGETEVILDGISCTPDIFSGIEVKSTRQSSKYFDLHENQAWQIQILGYCKVLNKLEYDLTVLFLMNNYAPPFPAVDCWHISTTQEEVDANWNMVTNRRDILIQSLLENKPPEPDCFNWEYEYCDFIDLCPDTECFRKRQLKPKKEIKK